MHDLHEANRILKLILEHARANNLKKVTQADIQLGNIVEHGSEILPANLVFNLRMLAQKTIAENLVVKIELIKGESWILKDIQGE